MPKAKGEILDVDLGDEQVVIATLINDPEQLPKVRAIAPGRFVAPRHRAIVRALRSIVRSGGAYAADTVVSLCGGEVKLSYLVKLEEEFEPVPGANLDLHLRRMDETRTKAESAEAFGEVFDAMDDPAATLDEIVERTSAFLRKVSAGSKADVERSGKAHGAKWIEDLRRSRVEGRGAFVPMHFSGLDEVLYEGMRAGKMTVLAARPGMGKTSFCSNLIMRHVLRNKKVLAVPIEAGIESVIEQTIAARSRVPVEKIIKAPHLLTEAQFRRIERASEEVWGRPCLHVDTSPSSLDDLELLVDGRGYELVVLDLFEYLIPGEKRHDVLTDALRRTRRMAETHGFHVVVVHQIRRIERKGNPRPKLTELKGSGGFEEVADIVLLLHREKYYKRDLPDDFLEVDLAKQRRGPANVTVVYEFDPRICRVGARDPSHDRATDLEDLRKEMEELEEEDEDETEE